jgi:hypothetical protein
VLPIEKIVDLLGVGKDLQILHLPGTTPLYINSKVPFGGTANPAFQFAADGTLTAASNQVQDQLPAAIASSFASVASSLVSIAGKSVGAASKSAGAGSPWVISGSMTVVPVRRLYAVTVVQVIRDDGKVVGQCGKPEIVAAFAAPSANSDCRISLTVQVVRGDQGPTSATSGSASNNAIQFSGTVVLPAAASGSASAASTSSVAPVGSTAPAGSHGGKK